MILVNLRIIKNLTEEIEVMALGAQLIEKRGGPRWKVANSMALRNLLKKQMVEVGVELPTERKAQYSFDYALGEYAMDSFGTAINAYGADINKKFSAEELEALTSRDCYKYFSETAVAMMVRGFMLGQGMDTSVLDPIVELPEEFQGLVVGTDAKKEMTWMHYLFILLAIFLAIKTNTNLLG